MKTILVLLSVAAVAVNQARAGWITFQNENKMKEGLPCIGAIYGNDNYLISTFDCGATDWNSTMCGIHAFPFSATTSVGKTPGENATGNGLWYAPHSVDTACQYLGDIKVEGNYTMAGTNVTSCGYIDWPRERNWGPVKAVPPYDVKTAGCWPVDKAPDAKYAPHRGHYFDGAAPMNQTFCDGGFAERCGENQDPFCQYATGNPMRINCTVTNMPDTTKSG